MRSHKSTSRSRTQRGLKKRKKILFHNLNEISKLPHHDHGQAGGRRERTNNQFFNGDISKILTLSPVQSMLFQNKIIFSLSLSHSQHCYSTSLRPEKIARELIKEEKIQGTKFSCPRLKHESKIKEIKILHNFP